MVAFKRAVMAVFMSAVVFAGSVSAQAGTIVQEAAKAGQFNTLIAAAKAAGLAGVLSAPGNYTVFAPTDAAFAKLPPGTVKDLLKPKNRGKLKAILLYHVVGSRILAKDIPHGVTHVKTLQGKSLRVRKGLLGVRVNKSRVVATDVKASNGVIHVIDSVLLP
jgi:uncharacterized surface protein with fasciclin (FAS1) repeats